jgi:hypothetical protein
MSLTAEKLGILDLTSGTSLDLATAVSPELRQLPTPEPETPDFVYYLTPLPTPPERGYVYDDPATNADLSTAARQLGLLGLAENIIAYKPDDDIETIETDSGTKRDFVGLRADYIASDQYFTFKSDLRINHNGHHYVRDLVPERTLAVLGLGAQVNRASRNGQRLAIEKKIGPEYYLG